MKIIITFLCSLLCASAADFTVTNIFHAEAVKTICTIKVNGHAQFATPSSGWTLDTNTSIHTITSPTNDVVQMLSSPPAILTLSGFVPK